VRRCNIPPTGCRHKYAAPCCADCAEDGCAARCQNHPDRCRCWRDGPPLRPRERTGKLDRAAILRLREAGLLQREIAERLGCSPSGVSAVLRQAGRDAHG